MSQQFSKSVSGAAPSYIVEGNAQTVGATTEDAITLSMGSTPTTSSVKVVVSCFEETTPAGGGYTLFGVFTTDGSAATEIGTEDTGFQESAALADCDAEVHAVGNDIVVQVTGVAGLTINWSARLEYLEV